MRILALLLMLLPTLALSQGAATLVADNVTLNGQDQLIASGNIEVLYEGNRLRASRIIYDQTTDQLTIEGPIVLQAADGTLLTADQASLDPQLENGVLQGARLVLDQQLQVAANQLDRRNGRYSQLYRTVASSCAVCGNRPPIWSIRAERVIHDQTEKQLYFENATFLIRDVPVAWIPRMRLPDPNLERATGLLIPEQANTTQLGTGIKIPYFITLGDNRDITVTPYLSPETRTLELIYRQAFVNGTFRAEGAVSDDTLEDENRSYVFAEGAFRLSGDYQLSFDIEAVSDRAYLLDYGYSGKDRLDSAIGLLRVSDSALTQVNLTYYQTLRDDEDNSSLPPIVADLSYETRTRPTFGGTLTLGASLDAAYRYSDTNGDAGRDVTRAGARAVWQQDRLLGYGIVGEWQTGVRADIYDVQDDTAFEDTNLRIVPHVGVTLRWPWAMTTDTGTSHLIEPTVLIAGSDQFGDIPPNEDSTRSEFDQANLFSISRFAGEDAVETGGQVAAGVTWTRTGAEGTISTLTFGRVSRTEDNADFTRSSGLANNQSDWVVVGQLQIPDGFAFDARTLFDDNLEPTRAASLIRWQNEEISLSAAYIWQAKDAAENRPDTVSEWTLDAAFELSQAWSLSLDARYDVAADRPVRGGIGLEWRNECVTIDVSASRRYTSSTTVDPTTSFGLSGSISGFSAGRSGGRPAARCTN